jgi:hypothetical protein
MCVKQPNSYMCVGSVLVFIRRQVSRIARIATSLGDVPMMPNKDTDYIITNIDSDRIPNSQTNCSQ